MDAHSRHIFTALHALLRLALACAPSDEALYRALRAALKHTEAALRETRPLDKSDIIRSVV
jgi:hypothetical protein